MRILACKFVGEETPKEFGFDVELIKSDELKEFSNMSNLGQTVQDWKRIQGLFSYYEWMEQIKKVFDKN
jgi:hypothetical protein